MISDQTDERQAEAEPAAVDTSAAKRPSPDEIRKIEKGNARLQEVVERDERALDGN